MPRRLIYAQRFRLGPNNNNKNKNNNREVDPGDRYSHGGESTATIGKKRLCAERIYENSLVTPLLTSSAHVGIDDEMKDPPPLTFCN